jgi:hypothetical protein
MVGWVFFAMDKAYGRMVFVAMDKAYGWMVF